MVHVEFDATLDEAVDVQMRFSSRTAAYRRQRKLSQWAMGGMFAVVLSGLIFGRLDHPVRIPAFLLVA